MACNLKFYADGVVMTAQCTIADRGRWATGGGGAHAQRKAGAQQQSAERGGLKKHTAAGRSAAYADRGEGTAPWSVAGRWVGASDAARNG